MIAITPAAQDKLAEILDAQVASDNQVRVSVVRGPHGCVHGWNLGIEHDRRPTDVVYAVGRFQVVIDPDLTEPLEGATIDYREGAAALGFIIDAPNSGEHGEHQNRHHH